MKQVKIHRPFKVQLERGNPASVASYQPGEQKIEDKAADIAIRNGWASAKSGRPKRETAATKPKETTTLTGVQPKGGYPQ